MNLVNLTEMTKEELREESMIDIAFAILTDRHEALTLEQLMNQIRELTGMSESEMKDRLLQFYTDMNIDGRFLAINNGWGLREWYPVDQIEEETAPVVKVRKKKKKKAYDDDDEEEEEEEIDEDELFDEEFDELDDEDDLDEDEDEDEEEEEDIIEIEEDLIEDDEELELVPDDELDIDDDEDDELDEDEEDL
ncbi:DNA-directed RNA polymerase subunit delta [Sporosarcina sp. FSL W8-0480]|uniref:DNA-directed RNA polymerase subunit delta n=1 Tax=Sporosarcina sp. FSL W8-0480 TaxID=2954701 RepID=UPI0030D941F8